MRLIECMCLPFFFLPKKCVHNQCRGMRCSISENDYYGLDFAQPGKKQRYRCFDDETRAGIVWAEDI